MTTKQEFGKFIWALSRAIPKFAPDFNDAATLDVWYSQFQDMDVSVLAAVFKSAIARCDEFPSIRRLIELAGTAPQSDEDAGREVGERIWATMERYGSQKFDLEKAIGPIGVAVVNMQGGWKAICDMATYDNAGILKAQWRELAEVLVRKSRGGDLNRLPQFEIAAPNRRDEILAALNITSIGKPR